MEDIQTMIERLCPNGVEYKPLSEVGTFTRGRRFVRADIVDSGYPCIHYGDMYTYYGIWATETRTFINPELASKLRYADKNDVIIVGAGENDEDIGIGMAWLGDSSPAVHDACYIFKHKEDPKYISYFLRSHDYHQQIKKSVSSGKICSISAEGIGRAMIPVPPVEIQRRIVEILDKYSKYTEQLKEALSAELIARQQQYEYYRDNLLDFNKLNRGGQNEVIWRTIDEVANVNRGVRVTKSMLSDSGYPVYQNSLTPMGYYEKKNVNANTPFVICGGTAGEIGFSVDDFWAADDCEFIVCKQGVSSKYIYHYLMKQKAFLKTQVRRASIPRLSPSVIRTLAVPIPSIKEQQRIVEILDQLEKLTTDLSQGIPAEIQARRQQYEYYRDKLLTFKRKTVA